MPFCGAPAPVPFFFIQDGGIGTTVLAVRGLNLPATSQIIVTGIRPVIFAIFGDATIEGTIDARSVDNTRPGAGTGYAGCGLMSGGDATGASGGGGAAFGNQGSKGEGPGGGDAGVPSANDALKPLHGGCEGGKGSDSGGSLTPEGGFGGGAVQLSTLGTLTVRGTISTSGSGGRGGFANQGADDIGGGGGGSGGAILLEARSLVVEANAKLTCNGGGGGGGREDMAAAGNPGQNGSLDTATAATGGQGGTANAGNGASGATSTSVAGVIPASSGINAAGSGAGGGGLGRIRFNASSSCSIGNALLSAHVSRPAPCQ